MTVSFGLGHRISGRDTACAWLVFNHHGLPHVVGHFLRHGTGRQISNAPWAERHDDFDRAARQRLGLYRQRQGCEKSQKNINEFLFQHALRLQLRLAAGPAQTLQQAVHQKLNACH